MQQAASVVVAPRGAARARSGHPWIFRSEVASAPELASGADVRVTDARGNFIGRAFWAVKSPIALRMVSRNDSALDDEFLRQRLSRALARRRTMFPGADAFRVIHGEADLLPGYFADLYGDVVAVQHLAEWAEARRETLARLLVELTGARAVVARDDGSSREFEQLPRHSEVLVGSAPLVARYREGEVQYEVDLMADHKTGGYLDQRENHLRAGELARGRALDAFCYHGGFALQLARRAASVLAIDQDTAAVARVQSNATLNGLRNVEARAGNAIEQLRALDKEGQKFDMIVLDPPAFAKRKDGLEAALRVYKEINYRGLRLLAPGGVMVTCSCSGRVTPELFGEVVGWAAQEAKRPIQILERRGAGRDHPALVGVPETDYLKAWFLLAP